MTLRNRHLELRLSELETATENLSRFLRSPQVFPDEPLAGPADAPKATCETNGHIYGVGAVCVFCGAPRPENPPHGPVSEKFMRHYYGASGAGPADAGSHERLIELEKRIRPKHEYCSSNGESLCRDQKLPEARSCSGCNRWRWADELKAIIAASASAPAARPHFRCSEGCGVVAVDEDGCCRTCGADASASAGADASASAPAVPRETTKEEKADMSPGSTAKANPKGSAPVGPACVCHQGSVCGPACLIGVCHTGCFSWPTPPETK
jgi:hypothetical protein